VFRIYDDDDTGLVSAKNLKRCAQDLGEEVNTDEIKMMLEMGDKDKKGGLNLKDFITIMKEVGLISKDLGK
jgi:centrin-3